MQNLLAGCIATAFCMSFADQAVAQADAPKSEYWEARVKQVRVGMTRGEVERLLPPYSPSKGETWNSIYTGRTTIGTGGAQGNAYYVAPGWHVSACYDYAGIPRDAHGTALPGSTVHPTNRLLSPVTLKWHSYERQPTRVDPD